MKITKFVHSCLLVETPDRTAVFDPGVMSEQAFDFDRLTRLDDIFITHGHPDHYSPDFVKKLVAKFPQVRITTTPEVVAQLKEAGITAGDQPPEGVTFFDAPHEPVEPLFPQPQNVGIHYLDLLSDPGDSHSFTETKAILALPITAPWGSTIKAANLAISLQPKFVIPIHDWHWSDDARNTTYDQYEKLLSEKKIQFFKPETGQPIDIPI